MPSTHPEYLAAAVQRIIRGLDNVPAQNVNNRDVILLSLAVQADFFEQMGHQLLDAVDKFHNEYLPRAYGDHAPPTSSNAYASPDTVAFQDAATSTPRRVPVFTLPAEGESRRSV